MRWFRHLLVAFSLAVTTPSLATTLTFDEFGTAIIPVPNGYGGFQWDNFYSVYTPDFTPSGYVAGTVSTGSVAYNNFGHPASFTLFKPFKLTSFYLTSAWYDGLKVEVTGFNGGNQMFTRTLLPSATAPTLYDFQNVVVDRVAFRSYDGAVHPGYLGDGTNFVLDNLTINGAAVPEVSTWLMLIAGLGATGVLLRRRLHESPTRRSAGSLA